MLSVPPNPRGTLTVTDVYGYWRAVLTGKGTAELLPTLGGTANGEHPQPGLWKVKPIKNGAWVPMQIWLADDMGQPLAQWQEGAVLRGTLNGKPVDSQVIVDRWLFVKPISKHDHAHFNAHGFWPADPPPLPVRSNMPADPFEALKAEADDRLAQAAEWLNSNAPIQGQIDCDKARNMQAALLDLGKRADVMHETEKRPHLEAGRAVDRKFSFRDQLKDWAANLRVAFEMWMRAEERRQREAAEAKFREERAKAEAERARIEAERAQKLKDDPVGALTDPEPELPDLPLAPEPVKVQSGGGVGRKAGLRDGWEFQITDYKLAALHVIEQPDVSAAVGKAIARLVKAGKGRVDIPGVKINTVRKVG